MENERKYCINLNGRNLVQQDEQGRRLATTKIAFEHDTPMEEDDFVESITNSKKFCVIMHDFLNKGTYFRMLGKVNAHDLKSLAINFISSLSMTYVAAYGEEAIEDFRENLRSITDNDKYWDGIIEQYRKKMSRK